MKYIIILGFFGTIVVVPAISSGNFEAKRIKHPDIWINAVRNCLTKMPKATYDSFIAYNMTTATVDAKCRALCYYTETGEFVDGKFDKIAIENFLRAYIGPHQSLEKLIEIYKAAADVGNAETGGNHDKAYAYHAALGKPENLRVMQVIFRTARDFN